MWLPVLPRICQHSPLKAHRQDGRRAADRAWNDAASNADEQIDPAFVGGGSAFVVLWIVLYLVGARLQFCNLAKIRFACGVGGSVARLIGFGIGHGFYVVMDTLLATVSFFADGFRVGSKWCFRRARPELDRRDRNANHDMGSPRSIRPDSSGRDSLGAYKMATPGRACLCDRASRQRAHH